MIRSPKGENVANFVINKIAECDDGKPKPRKIQRIEKFVVHRIGDSLGETAEEIAVAFRDTSKYAAGSYTNAQQPYTWIIRKDGTIEQALAMTDTGPHAKRWNTRSVSVALIGDFTKHKPTDAQWDSLVNLSVAMLRMGFTIHGHTELPGSSGDLNKRCPGPHLNMEQLRKEARSKINEAALQHLLDMGIKL
mgnify:CR=1 FL=1